MVSKKDHKKKSKKHDEDLDKNIKQTKKKLKDETKEELKEEMEKEKGNEPEKGKEKDNDYIDDFKEYVENKNKTENVKYYDKYKELKHKLKKQKKNKKNDMLSILNPMAVSPFSTPWSPPPLSPMVSTDVGAGVIILEIYNNGFGRNELAVVLGQNAFTFKYEDFGCRRNLMEALDNTASRNLNFESKNVFFFTNLTITSSLMYRYLFNSGVSSYVSYFIKIPSGILLSTDYSTNNFIINGSVAPSDWRKTFNMQRFYLSDLIAAGLNTAAGDLIGVFDASGLGGNIITHRTKSAIRNAHSLYNLNTIPQIFVTKTLSYIAPLTHPYLNGTTCIQG